MAQEEKLKFLQQEDRTSGLKKKKKQGSAGEEWFSREGTDTTAGEKWEE